MFKVVDASTGEWVCQASDLNSAVELALRWGEMYLAREFYVEAADDVIARVVRGRLEEDEK